MSNIPVDPIVLAISIDLKDGAGKKYRLKVRTDGHVTLSLEEVTDEATTNQVPGLEVQSPRRSETVDLLSSSDDSKESEDDGKDSDIDPDALVDLTNASDDCFSPVAEVKPSRSAHNRSAPATSNNRNTNPTATKKKATTSTRATTTRATTTRATTNRVTTNPRGRATTTNDPPRATTNKQPRAKNPRRPLPYLFSDEEEDYETAGVSQEFWS